MPPYPHTRSKDRLHNLAAFYVGEGFDNLPEDEATLFNEEQKEKLRYWINDLRKNEEITAKLRGRPWPRGTREAVIGRSVGADYREELNQFLATNDLIAQSQSASGGRKSRKRKSKKRKSRKRKSRKRKSRKRKSRGLRGFPLRK